MPIELLNVFHVYSKNTPFQQTGLKNINLKILDNHKFVALVGHTGSGKSTLAQHINALLLPTSGEVRIDDFTITPKKKKNKHIKDLRKHAGLVFQFPEYQLFEDTVLNDVAFGPKNFGIKVEDAKLLAKNALRSVGIGDEYFERSPFELSGGEKRRVAIAGIIALNPKILILDEPTAGLDPRGVKQLMDLFTIVRQNGTRIIFISHNMDHVLEYCDYAIVMKNGEVVKEDTPNNLFKDDLISELALEMPVVFSVAKQLMNKGLKLNLDNIYNISSLAKEIKRARDR